MWGLVLFSCLLHHWQFIHQKQFSNMVVGAEIMYSCGYYFVRQCHCQNKY